MYEGNQEELKIQPILTPAFPRPNENARHSPHGDSLL